MTALTRSEPSAQTTDARGVIAFLDAIEGVSGIEPHSIMLLRHGHVIAEGWWAPYDPDGVQQVYSLSKSFTATAAGFAWAEGLLDLDAPVVSYFPELDSEITDPRSRSILVRHIASMSAGHTSEQWDRALATYWEEPVRGFLLDPPDGTPGVTFAYSQSTTYALGAIIQRQSGQSLVEYLRPRLFEPLGIGEAFWLRHPPAGRDLAFAGLHVTTDAIARLGQLYLQGGVWEGRQLLAPEWVAEATRKQVDNSNSDGSDSDSDWSQGYGFQFWMARHGYRGDGAFGQLCVVLPEHDVVLAMTSESVAMHLILEAAWTHLLPAFDREGSAEADAALKQRLTGLQLPFPDGEDVPDSEFTVAHTVVERLRKVSLTAQKLTLQEEDGTVTTLPLLPGSWPPPTGHLSARAVRTDADTVRVHLQFVQSPHKLVITGDLRSGTFKADWRVAPLGRVSQLSLFDLANPEPRTAP
ncbi:serine hydrolase domain-containing protein [Catenulispora rubra]|uniref:serine hydrolase domain-containing protein n=1 Tax=Catenulispora rubra TaxID=280293 RepID=UPI0018921F9A|nr:serine hydrolase domain-containing protein [Catenulispora rubra]